MCLSYVHSKETMRGRTSKNLNAKEIVAWKVVRPVSRRPLYRAGRAYLKGDSVSQRSDSRKQFLQTCFGIQYPCGLHLCLSRQGAREYKKLTNWEDALVVKVVVSQDDILAWGVDRGKLVLVVKCCRVIS